MDLSNSRRCSEQGGSSSQESLVALHLAQGSWGYLTILPTLNISPVKCESLETVKRILLHKGALRVFDNRTNTFATNILKVLKSACTENSSRSSSIIVGRNDHLHHHRHYFQPVRGHQGGREKILPNPCTFQAAQCQARRTRSDLSLNHVCF